jgi:hypothetical protein
MDSIKSDTQYCSNEFRESLQIKAFEMGPFIPDLGFGRCISILLCGRLKQANISANAFVWELNMHDPV